MLMPCKLSALPYCCSCVSHQYLDGFPCSVHSSRNGHGYERDSKRYITERKYIAHVTVPLLKKDVEVYCGKAARVAIHTDVAEL